MIYNGSIAGAKPERSQNFELGTKWNLFDEKLLLTAAVFQITKSDVMEGANYDTDRHLQHRQEPRARRRVRRHRQRHRQADRPGRR